MQKPSNICQTPATWAFHTEGKPLELCFACDEHLPKLLETGTSIVWEASEGTACCFIVVQP